MKGKHELQVGCVCIFVSLFASQCLAQEKGDTEASVRSSSGPVIEVGPDRLVATDSKKRALIEPSLTIDSENPNHWLVATTVIPPRADLWKSASDCAALVSFNGGKSWQRHDFGFKSCTDSWVGFLPGGVALLTVLASNSSASDTGELLVYRSEDGGRAWASKPFSLGSGYDHETFFVSSGTVYITTSQQDGVVVVRSVDQDRSFETESSTSFSGLSKDAMNSVLRPDGVLLTTFVEYGRHLIGERGVEGPFSYLQHGHSWIMASGDGGKTYSPPNFIGEYCSEPGWWQWLAQDESQGAYRGRLYWLCDENGQKVLLQHSQDGGKTWSTPIKVNGDKGMDPLDPYVSTPMIAVDRNGVVGIGWYDGRRDANHWKGWLRCQQLYFTVSFDGGSTFVPEVLVSSAESCPVTLDSKNGDAAFRFPSGGDYWGLIPGSNGQFHFVWSDSRTGLFELRSASVVVRQTPAK
jgi:hypothetical protein